MADMRDGPATDLFVHPTAVVDAPCRIGTGTRIWHFSHVMKGAVIGRGCTLGQNVFIAGSAVVGNGVKIQNNVSVYDGVVLEDDVFIGPSAVFTNVSNPRAHVSRREAYETTRVGRGATIGANVTVVCGNEIGAFALVGAGATVVRSVPDHALMVGNPAVQKGWVCDCGERLDDRSLQCGGCGAVYLRDGAGLTRKEEGEP